MSNITKEMMEEAASLSILIINRIQEESPDINPKMVLLSLGIALATLSKGTDVPLHSLMELVMSIYKHTEIIKYE
jgi:hypothetical protein